MPPARISRHPPAAPLGYDPHTRRIELEPGATPYHLSHERAHEAQQAAQTRIWRLNAAIPRWMPYLSRVTALLVEIQASRMALDVLQWCGRRDRAAEAEASRCLWSYWLALLLVPTPAERMTVEVASTATAQRIAETERRLGPQQPAGLPELVATAAETGRE